MKKPFSHVGSGEHVVRPDEQREEADRHRREGDRLVAEDRLAAEHRQHLGDHAEGRQDHDVDLRVAEEPEGVLVEQRLAAAGREEEARAELAVEQQQREARRERRQDGDEEPRVDLDRPHEERQAHPRHPRGAHVVDRDDEVDRAHERRGREDVEPEDPVVLPVARRLDRERRVAVPAGARGAALGEEAPHQHDPSEEEQPVRERVQPREGHVARADHQGHEEVRDAGPHRHDDEEDHRRPVHRHDLVVRVAREELAVGRDQLRAHEQRHHAAGDEEEQGRPDVQDPDPLVVDRRQPRGDAAGHPVGPVTLRLSPGRHRHLLRPRGSS
jgi:hypothetical protein